MAGSLRRRGKIWWGRVRKTGQKDRERSLETESKAIARQRLAAWTAELEAVRWREPVGRTLHQAIERFAAEHFDRLKPKSAQRYTVSIANLINHLPDIALGQIGSAELSGFERARLKEGVTTATIRRDLACLSSIYSRAEEWEWVQRNPVKPFLRGRAKAGLTEGLARTRYLTLAEESAVLQEAGPKAAAAIVFAIDTGLRKEEQFSLRTDDIDLAGNWLTVRAEIAKNGRARRVPLLPRTRAWLQKRLQGRGGYVFETGAGERYSPQSPTMAEAFQKACRKAGITDRPRWHDLRRTCGCRLLQEHRLTIHAVSQWLGHADVRVTQQRYAFLAADALQDAIARPGDIRGDMAPPETLPRRLN
jgi:integrase/recombinase XerD